MTFPAATAIAGLAAYVMVSAGIAKRRISVRGRVCQTCGNRRDRCTCRWL